MHLVTEDIARVARSRGKGEAMQAANFFAWVYVQNYSGLQINMPSQGPIPGTSTVLVPAGYWVEKLRG